MLHKTTRQKQNISAHSETGSTVFLLFSSRLLSKRKWFIISSNQLIPFLYQNVLCACHWRVFPIHSEWKLCQYTYTLLRMYIFFNHFAIKQKEILSSQEQCRNQRIPEFFKFSVYHWGGRRISMFWSPWCKNHGSSHIRVSRLELKGMYHLKKYIMKALLPVIDTGSQFVEHFSQELLLLSKLFSSKDKGHYNLLDSCEGMAGEHFAMIQQWKINSDYIAVLVTIPGLSKLLLIPLTRGDTSYSLCKTHIQTLSLKLNEDL